MPDSKLFNNVTTTTLVFNDDVSTNLVNIFLYDETRYIFLYHIHTPYFVKSVNSMPDSKLFNNVTTTTIVFNDDVSMYWVNIFLYDETRYIQQDKHSIWKYSLRETTISHLTALSCAILGGP